VGQLEEKLKFLDDIEPEELDDIQILEKLRRRLNNSRTEQYCGFLEMRDEDCSYVHRSREKFEEFDLPDIRKLVLFLAQRMKRYGAGNGK